MEAIDEGMEAINEGMQTSREGVGIAANENYRQCWCSGGTKRNNIGAI